MEKPKRLFGDKLRCSWRSADRFITKARTRRFVAVDPLTGKTEVREKVHRPSRAEVLAVLVPAIQHNHQMETDLRSP